MSVLIFIAVLSILIIFHELGHFVIAKYLGVNVERFAVGFGPKLLSRKFKGTEFAICAVPLGGYVKMAGDERSECKGLADEYYSRPPGHRALIVFFGPVVNYLLAFLCFWCVFIVGYPTLAPKVGELLDGYPAQEAGLRIDDTIISIDGKKVESWEQMQKYIASSKGKKIGFALLRGGYIVEKHILPRMEKIENIFGQKENIRLVGIKPKEEIITLHYNVFASFGNAVDKLSEITIMTYKAIYRMITGGMSAKDSLTGPIGIFYIIKQAATMGFSYLLYIMAVISASLGIFNLLPLPILDGGHLLLLGVERLRGRPIPQRIDDIINRVGLSLIICLAVFVFYSDFVRFGWFDKIISLWRGLVS